MLNFQPRSQKELLLAARAGRTQVEFARILGVDRTSLSRYENELLGAPVSVINFCLSEVAKRGVQTPESPLERALDLVRGAAEALEEIALTAPRPPQAPTEH